MDPSSTEDPRGVDVVAIRERLALTPAQRVRRLIDEVRVWTEIRAAAAGADDDV